MPDQDLPLPPTPPTQDPHEADIDFATPLNNPSTLTYTAKLSSETINQALQQAQAKKLITNTDNTHQLAQAPQAGTSTQPDHPINQTYKGIITAIIFLSVSSLAIFITTNFLTTTNTAPATISADYYQQLYNNCQQTTNIACCVQSVRVMELNNFQLSPNSCPTNTTTNQLDCPTSHSWCEPK